MNGHHFIIVGSAPLPDAEAAYASIMEAADIVIAADGGVDLCFAVGRTPDFLVGDFDSVSPASLTRAGEAGVRIMTFPAEKDESDLDLALALARRQGAMRVTFTAAFSRRLDHTLAALGTLARSADLDGEVREPGWEAYALDACARPSLGLAEDPNTVLSLMACTGQAVVSVTGVRYPLAEHRLEPLSSLGLSNVAAAPSQRVDVHSGQVVVLVNRSAV